jgi:hypothetical protein
VFVRFRNRFAESYLAVTGSRQRTNAGGLRRCGSDRIPSFGGWAVQREQLARLLDVAGLRNVELQVMPNHSTGHAGMSGPFTLLTPPERGQIAYVEVQHVSRLISDPREVRALATKYGSLRAAAMTPRETMVLIEGMLEAS